MEDTREELERLEQELLAEEPAVQEQVDESDALLEELIREVKAQTEEEDVFLDDALLRENLPEDAAPAFEDPDKIHEPEELVYSNFANDYGKELQEKEAEEQEKKAYEDRLQIILMITASVLALGIIGILIYWLVAFF